MLHPTAFLKGAGLGAKCALITDGRFSGGSKALRAYAALATSAHTGAVRRVP